jgi:4-hydroxybenzoate polyprenyltransferase
MSEESPARRTSKLGLLLVAGGMVLICIAIVLIRPILLVYVAGISLPIAVIYAFETARPRLLSASCATIGAALAAPVLLAGFLYSERAVHLEMRSWIVPFAGMIIAAIMATALPWIFGRVKTKEQGKALDRMEVRAQELRDIWGDRLDRPLPKDDA